MGRAPDSGAPGERLSEKYRDEFGTAREVLFSLHCATGFADVLRLRNSDGSLDTEASVVAVQYHPGVQRWVAAALSPRSSELDCEIMRHLLFIPPAGVAGSGFCGAVVEERAASIPYS